MRVCFHFLYLVQKLHASAVSPLSFTSKPPARNNEKKFKNQLITQWFCCSVCSGRLFTSDHIVGSVGAKTILQKEVEEQQQTFNPYLPERRFFIVDWTCGTMLRLHRRRCTENIKQYVCSCPTCHMYLSAPVQTCLANTAAPTKRCRFRRYKRSIKSFSCKYQVIRTLLVELENPPQF